MILSRLTAKAQVTVPQAVRKALGLGPGEQIAWRIEGGEVIVARPDDPFINNFATFDEWATEADCKAFDNL